MPRKAVPASVFGYVDETLTARERKVLRDVCLSQGGNIDSPSSDAPVRALWSRLSGVAETDLLEGMINIEHGCFHVKDQGPGWFATKNSPAPSCTKPLFFRENEGGKSGENALDIRLFGHFNASLGPPRGLPEASRLGCFFRASWVPPGALWGNATVKRPSACRRPTARKYTNK